jgi:hypothetical protein
VSTVSLGGMIERIGGLTKNDVTPWESDFIDSMVEKYEASGNTGWASAKQAEIIERIFNKHFAG